MDVYRFPEGTQLTARVTGRREVEIDAAPAGMSDPLRWQDVRLVYLSQFTECVAHCARSFAAGRPVRFIVPALQQGVQLFGLLMQRVPMECAA
jgi:hypothetical protein